MAARKSTAKKTPKAEPAKKEEKKPLPQEKPPAAANPKSDAADPNEKVVSALAYVGLISVIIWAVYRDKGNKNVLYHSIQGMLMFACVFVLGFCLAITILGLILVPFVFIGYLILVVVMAYKAYSGEKYKLPVIGNFAESHA